MTDQVLSNLADAFRADAATLVQTKVTPPESVELAANVTTIDADYMESNRPQFGYWILTTERLLRVWFSPSRSWLSNRPLARARYATQPERKVVLPPPSTLDRDELKSRRVKESYLDRFIETNWEKLLSPDSVSLYSVSIRALPDDTIWAVMFSEKDAVAFCEKISSSVRRRAAPKAIAGNELDGVPALIYSLGQLRDAGVLTDDEFESKKRLLLDRI